MHVWMRMCMYELGVLIVPFAYAISTQDSAYSVVGPSLWNGPTLALSLIPRVLSNFFYDHLKSTF